MTPMQPSVFRLPTLACAVLMALCGHARAEPEPEPQAPPQALPEPQMRAPSQARFTLTAIEFVGNTRFTDSDLQTMVANRIGQEVALADLEDIAKRVTARYRDRGYFLAQAVVPVQEVEQGRVTISIVEGTLGQVEIDVDPDAPIPPARVEKTLMAALQPGQALNGPRYERAMLLLSDLPGIRPKSAVESGAAIGSTDLNVQVSRGEALGFVVEVDNHGTPESGRIRAGGTMRWASPSGHGDNLDLRVMLAEDAHTAFGRLAYELPVGYDGLRIGAGVARVQYELGGGFRPLRATGTADIADVSATYPLIRQRGTNLFLRFGFDRKSLTDEFEAVGFETEKRIRGATAGWSFEHRDALFGGGYTSVNGVLYRGELDIRDPVSEFIDQSPIGRKTQGYFTKFTVQATRLQALTQDLSLFLGVGVQLANRNLDSSEQLSLGGPRAVRAYSTNEALVDEGWIANLELRYALNERATPFLFYDAAHGAFAHDRSRFVPENGKSLRGYGLGLSWARPGNWAFNATLAWPDGIRAVADRREPRLYLQLQKHL
ncbi:ShlB/FhaC/HecB family hemolysin secretion/activation protein [Lysobacter gummosus]|uniref:ShlB/FhaC/HecB family hemolysin secretion/activation protein n=1 Tax=Lysobacter gummosus TaxID=262324 RepID=UPI00363C05D6